MILYIDGYNCFLSIKLLFVDLTPEDNQPSNKNTFSRRNQHNGGAKFSRANSNQLISNGKENGGRSGDFEDLPLAQPFNSGNVYG